ncbi:MAG: hypothetical protein KGJ58_03655 [Patescibacteria group bacterium]|nr:hypothetical protein [Patescibacteria group bacterium]MDE2218519.1 hypothetical protein [Patescibacteria group bacterium]
MKNKNEGMSEMKNGILVGAGIISLAAGVAGTYFLYGSKTAAKNRKKIRGWTLKAKGEILEKLESFADVSEETYHGIVKEIIGKYESLKHIDAAEIKEFASELLAHWKNIKKDIESAVAGQNKSKIKTNSPSHKKTTKK